MKTKIHLNNLYTKQLRLIAEKNNINLKTDEGKLAAIRILVSRGIAFN